MKLSRLGNSCSSSSRDRISEVGFEATLVVMVFWREGALETSDILLLELVKEIEDALAFLLLFILVNRVKTTALVSSASTIISTLGESVGIGLES